MITAGHHDGSQSEGVGARPHRFAIYLPSGAEGSDGNSGRMIEEVERFLCEKFGGATSYPAKGLFKRTSGKMEREAVQVVEAYCEAQAWEDSKELVFQWAAGLATHLGQESIACLVQGRMHLVGPKPGALGMMGDFGANLVQPGL